MIKPKLLARRLNQPDGSITLEAAIILPVIIAFVLLMVSMIQIASAELALRSAVSETGKSIAAYWSPVRMVYGEAKGRVLESKPGVWAQEALNRVESVRSGLTGTEDWLMQYEAMLPDPMIQLLKWEIEKREGLEEAAADHAESAVQRITQPLLCGAFEPVLRHYANSKLLKFDRLKVESVRLPSLEPGGNPYVELVASYSFTLPVPFWSRTIRLEKKSYERAWVGDG